MQQQSYRCPTLDVQNDQKDVSLTLLWIVTASSRKRKLRFDDVYSYLTIEERKAEKEEERTGNEKWDTRKY